MHLAYFFVFILFIVYLFYSIDSNFRVSFGDRYSISLPSSCSQDIPYNLFSTFFNFRNLIMLVSNFSAFTLFPNIILSQYCKQSLIP